MLQEPTVSGPTLGEVGEDGADFRAGQDHWEFGGTPHALDSGDEVELSLQNLLIKKEQRTERLILGGCCDRAIDGEVAEEGGDL